MRFPDSTRHSSARWRAGVLVCLLLTSTLLTLPASAAPPPGDSEVFNNVCSTWNDTDGICDDYDFSHDRTPSQEWVRARYLFAMQDTSSVSLTMEWEVHEFNRSHLGLQDLDLGGNFSLPDSGAPADYIRNYLSMSTSLNMSVRDLMLSEINDAVEELVIETYGGEVDSIETSFVPEVTMNNVAVACTENPDRDSADEVLNVANNAFQPPLCLRTTANIRVGTDIVGLGNESVLDIERAYQGLLTMGGAVTTDMSLFSPVGHESTFEIVPPAYGTIESVDASGATPIRQQGPYQYKIGSWTVSNLDAASGTANMIQNVSMVTTSRDAIPRVVKLDLENDTGLEVAATLDLRDEMANRLTLEIGMHYLSTETLDAWGIELLDSNIDIPWVTSDGFRLAYHNGLVDLEDFSDAVPMNRVNDTIQDYTPLDVNMGPLTWLDSNLTGGLNFSYIPGRTCSEGTAVNYCLQGSDAMNGTYPVYMTSTSDPFRAEPVTVLNDLFADREGFPDISSLTTEDLAAVLSVIEYEYPVNTSFIAGLVPSDLPPTDITLTVILPDWITSTEDGSNTITLFSRAGETEEIPIGVTGEDPYHARWDEAICERSSPCTDGSSDLICHSTWKTCLSIAASLDFSDLNVMEWSQVVDLVFSGEVRIEIYRLEVPEYYVNQEGLTVSAVPADLIRHAISVGDTTEGGLSALFDENITLPIGEADYTLELSNMGIQNVADEMARYMTSQIQAQEMNQDGVSMDFSGVRVQAMVDTLDRPRNLRIDDAEPVGISLKLQPTSVRASVTEAGFTVDTGVAQSLMLALLGGVTQSLGGGLAAETGGGGALTFPDEAIVVQVDPIITQRDLDDTYDSDGDGDRRNDIDIEVRPAITFDLLLPTGLTLELTSAKGNDELVQRQDGRQQIIYRVPLCMAEKASQCGTESDEVSFRLNVGYAMIVKELMPYLLGAAGLILLLLIARARKRRASDEMLEEQRELARVKSASQTEVERELAGMAPISSGAPPAASGADSHWFDGINLDDDEDWT